MLPADITYIVHPTSRAQLERDALTATAANDKAAAAAAASGAPAPVPRIVIVPPAAMTGDKQVIDLGGIEAQVLFLGRAHTGGDLMVYLPKQKILFMSEAYLNRVFPAMRSAYPSEWVKTLDRALAMDVDRYVPGHGFVEEPEGVARGAARISEGAQGTSSPKSSRLHKLGLSRRRCAQAGELGSVQGMDARRSAGPHRHPQGLRRNRGQAEMSRVSGP